MKLPPPPPRKLSERVKPKVSQIFTLVPHSPNIDTPQDLIKEGWKKLTPEGWKKWLFNIHPNQKHTLHSTLIPNWLSLRLIQLDNYLMQIMFTIQHLLLSLNQSIRYPSIPRWSFLLIYSPSLIYGCQKNKILPLEFDWLCQFQK